MAAREIVQRVLESLWTAFPQCRPDNAPERDRSVGLWTEICADVADASLAAACSAVLRGPGQMMPSPGQVRARAIATRPEENRDAALEAWKQIIDSDYGRASIDDPLAERAMELLGGLSAFAASPAEDEHFWRDHFVQLYSQLLDRGSPSRTWGEPSASLLRIAGIGTGAHRVSRGGRSRR